MKYSFCFLDLVKLYNSEEMDPDVGPTQLQRKVMFDIHYYFCRRGTENFQHFNKNTFKLMFDTDTGITYMKKVQDKMSKNHHETNQEIIMGFMPQMVNANKPHHLHPVRSFENYVNNLNPKIDNMWQRPLTSKPSTGNIWFAAVPLGHNPIEKFMSKMSKLCNLTDHYTNHCV